MFGTINAYGVYITTKVLDHCYDFWVKGED